MRPIPTDLFRAFLKQKGLIHKRTKGGHEIWDYPDNSLSRPIVFRAHEKEIPWYHINKNLKTLGVSVLEFNRIIQTL